MLQQPLDMVFEDWLEQNQWEWLATTPFPLSPSTTADPTPAGSPGIRHRSWFLTRTTAWRLLRIPCRWIPCPSPAPMREPLSVLLRFHVVHSHCADDSFACQYLYRPTCLDLSRAYGLHPVVATILPAGPAYRSCWRGSNLSSTAVATLTLLSAQTLHGACLDSTSKRLSAFPNLRTCGCSRWSRWAEMLAALPASILKLRVTIIDTKFAVSHQGERVAPKRCMQ